MGKKRKRNRQEKLHSCITTCSTLLRFGFFCLRRQGAHLDECFTALIAYWHTFAFASRALSLQHQHWRKMLCKLNLLDVYTAHLSIFKSLSSQVHEYLTPIQSFKFQCFSLLNSIRSSVCFTWAINPTLWTCALWHRSTSLRNYTESSWRLHFSYVEECVYMLFCAFNSRCVSFVQICRFVPFLKIAIFVRQNWEEILFDCIWEPERMSAVWRSSVHFRGQIQSSLL